jgi:hypothetical protein
MFHELLPRDREDGRATRSAGACAACRATTGCWTRGVPERYVAGYNTRGRPEGRPYQRSQLVMHETSGLDPSTESGLDPALVWNTKIFFIFFSMSAQILRA